MSPATLEFGAARVAVPDRVIDLADPASWEDGARLVDAADIAVMTAEHGTRVRLAAGPGRQPPADALVTREAGLALAALAADCVPVALIAHDAVAVVHAGWRGVLHGAVSQALAALHQMEAPPTHAVVGPSICATCYEVPAERVAQFQVGVPAAVRDARHLDLTAGVLAQLAHADVDVTLIPGCTLESADLCSYRGGDETRRGGIIVARRGSDA